MTISGTDGATELHTDLEQFESRLDVELQPYLRAFGPRLFVPVLTSATALEDRATYFIPHRDCMVHFGRAAITPLASGSMNWTVALDAVNPVDLSLDNQWMQFNKRVNVITTASTTKTGGSFQASRRVQLTAGIAYQLSAEVDHATGGGISLTLLLDYPALQR